MNSDFKNSIKQLAIVIPAYKHRYIGETLHSILAQTNQQFNLYIGIDGYNAELENKVTFYNSYPNVIIHIFPNNLGKKDLVAQWERCIALTKNEEYIWLFPDDDIMSPDCVDTFYNFIDETPDKDLLRFKICRINETGEQITPVQEVPERETADKFMINLILNSRLSSVAEYIFSRNIYTTTGGFINFPAAWGSDNATWFKFAENNPIYTLRNGIVSVRHGNENISNVNYLFKKEKLTATYLYIQFLCKKKFFSRNKLVLEADKNIYELKKNWIFNAYYYYDYVFSFSEIIQLAYRNSILFNDSYLKNVYRLILWNVKRKKRNIKN